MGGGGGLPGPTGSCFAPLLPGHDVITGRRYSVLRKASSNLRSGEEFCPVCPPPWTARRAGSAGISKQHKLLLMRGASEYLVWRGATSTRAKCLAGGLDKNVCDGNVAQGISGMAGLGVC